MNPRCATFAESLTTGGPIRRYRARRHADRCPRCAAVRDELERVVEALAAAPSLTAAERRLWTAAAGDEVVGLPPGGWWRRAALAGTMAALLAAAWAWWAPPPVEHRIDVPPVAGVAPQPGSPTSFPEVEGLRGGLVALASELDELGRRAELLDARRDVDALMARLAPRVPARGL